MTHESGTQKEYTERAVQTVQCLQPAAANDLSCITALADAFQIKCAIGSGGTEEDSYAIDSLDKPSRSSHGPSQYCDSSSSAAFLQRPTSNKPFQLHYNRPSACTEFERRIVSFPETSPAYKVGAAFECARIVSMPDQIRSTRTASPSISSSEHYSKENSFDSSDTSADFNHTRTSSHRLHQDGIPQTPSPPSSPESILIVGHYTPQISKTFLQRKTDAYSKQDGWISWASSPPRPIPALHGPSSLPYARCPSGAEGTITEGDDISGKIWGLDAQANSISKRQNIFPSEGIPRTSRNRPLNNTPIFSKRYMTGLQQPTLPTLYDDVDNCGEHLNRPQPDAEEFCNTRPSSGQNRNQRSQASLYAGKGGLGIKLGVDHHGSCRDRIQGFYRKDSHGFLSPDSTESRPLNSGTLMDSFGSSRIIKPPQRKSAFDIAHEYHTKMHLQNPFPTPPSTCSPQWSTFSTDGNSHPSPEFQLFPPHRQHENRISQSNQHTNSLNYVSPIPDDQFYPVPAAARVPTSCEGLYKKADNTESKASATYPHTDPRHISLAIPALSDSDLLQKFSHQPPKSIPLTRLLQKCISTLTEDDREFEAEYKSPIQLISGANLQPSSQVLQGDHSEVPHQRSTVNSTFISSAPLIITGNSYPSFDMPIGSKQPHPHSIDITRFGAKITGAKKENYLTGRNNGTIRPHRNSSKKRIL